MAVVNAMCMEPKEDVVQQIREIIEEGYESMGISVRNACSFGVLEYPCEDMTPEDVVENLIALIRIAKQDVDQPFMEYSVDNLKRIKKMSNMALALGEDVMHDMENFRVVVQPVVAAQTGKVIGGEVLLRWQFEGRDISPGLFIPILEKNGMIHIAGRWVFEQAVRNCLQMLTYNPDFYLTFNISLHQLSDTELLGFMQQTLEKYHLPGSHLVAELTESCLDEQPESWNSWLRIVAIWVCGSRWTISVAAIRRFGCCCNIRPALSSWIARCCTRSQSRTRKCILSAVLCMHAISLVKRYAWRVSSGRIRIPLSATPAAI